MPATWYDRAEYTPLLVDSDHCYSSDQFSDKLGLSASAIRERINAAASYAESLTEHARKRPEQRKLAKRGLKSLRWISAEIGRELSVDPYIVAHLGQKWGTVPELNRFSEAETELRDIYLELTNINKRIINYLLAHSSRPSPRERNADWFARAFLRTCAHFWEERTGIAPLPSSRQGAFIEFVAAAWTDLELSSESVDTVSDLSEKWVGSHRNGDQGRNEPT